MAKQRGIVWLLTFVEWLAIWEVSGRLDDRGRGKGDYVMARKGDEGPYAWWNVDIVLGAQNNSDANKGKKRPRRRPVKRRSKLTDEQIESIRREHIPGLLGSKLSRGVTALGRKYDVSYGTIERVIKRSYTVYK